MSAHVKLLKWSNQDERSSHGTSHTSSRLPAGWTVAGLSVTPSRFAAGCIGRHVRPDEQEIGFFVRDRGVYAPASVLRGASMNPKARNMAGQSISHVGWAG